MRFRDLQRFSITNKSFPIIIAAIFIISGSIIGLTQARSSEPGAYAGKKIHCSYPYLGKKSICICYDTLLGDKTDLDVEKKLREVGLKTFPEKTRTYRMKCAGNRFTHYFFCPNATGVLCLEDLGGGLNMISIIPTTKKIPDNMPILDSLHDGGIAFLDGHILAVIDSSEVINSFNLSSAIGTEKSKKVKISLSKSIANGNEEIIVLIISNKNKEKKFGLSRLTGELFEIE